MIRFATAALLALAATATPISVSAEEARAPGFVENKPVLIDVTKNPGCGVKGLSAAERTERNRRLALYYFQASVEEAERDFKYSLAIQGCQPDSGRSSWLYGAFTPPPAQPMMVQSTSDGAFLQEESRAWRKAFPDFGALPGTLRVIPWDGGVFFTLMYGGTSKAGEKVAFWEVVTMLVNDEGKVYHYECWNDPDGLERGFRIAFGRSFKGMSFPEYFKLIHDNATPAKGAAAN